MAAIGECTLTTDLWTSSHQQCSYISLTVYFIDADIKVHSVRSESYRTLMVSPFVVSFAPCYKTEDLRQSLLWDNRQWLGHCKSYWALGDCSHTLQLAIIKALQVPRVHNIIIARCKELVEHFKISSKDTYKLREMMLQLPQHQLIQECPTRWGSTLSMLKRLAEQQAAIAAVLMEEKVK